MKKKKENTLDVFGKIYNVSISDVGKIEVWDEEYNELFYVFDKDTPTEVVELAMKLYQNGFDDGKKVGKIQLQTSIQKLLGIN